MEWDGVCGKYSTCCFHLYWKQPATNFRKQGTQWLIIPPGNTGKLIFPPGNTGKPPGLGAEAASVSRSAPEGAMDWQDCGPFGQCCGQPSARRVMSSAIWSWSFIWCSFLGLKQVPWRQTWILTHLYFGKNTKIEVWQAGSEELSSRTDLSSLSEAIWSGYPWEIRSDELLFLSVCVTMAWIEPEYLKPSLLKVS